MLLTVIIKRHAPVYAGVLFKTPPHTHTLLHWNTQDSRLALYSAHVRSRLRHNFGVRRFQSSYPGLCARQLERATWICACDFAGVNLSSLCKINWAGDRGWDPA